LVVTVRGEIALKKPKQWTWFDANLANITALINGKIVRYDLKRLYHIHRVYEIKRGRIQRLSKHKPITAERLMEKYSRRERNRAEDFMHKSTTEIAKELSEKGSGAILGNLKNIKGRVLRRSKDLNRKLSKRNARTFQSMLEYKLKWLGLPVKYVNSARSSKACPVCRATLVAYRGGLVKCKKCGLLLDRDVVAVLNLQMWGSGVMMGKRLVDRDLHLSMKVYQPRTPHSWTLSATSPTTTARF